MQQPSPIVDNSPRSKHKWLTAKRSIPLLAAAIVLLGMLAWRVTSQRSNKPSSAPDNDAEVEAMLTIGVAAHQWQTYFGDAVCPSVRQLVERKALDATVRKADPWDQPYAIKCMDTEVIVTSSGPDRLRGTPDDIVVSAARRR